jgi:hypothetical protein
MVCHVSALTSSWPSSCRFGHLDSQFRKGCSSKGLIEEVSEISKVFIATPCFGGLVTQSYMQSVIALMQHQVQPPLNLTLALLGNDALITRSRNTLVSTFLNDSDATHLLFIDADISFAPEQVTRLLAADKDVVGAMYPIKALDWEHAAQRLPHSRETGEEAALHYVGTPLDDPHARWDGDFVTASYVGTGMMMIRRRVFDLMVDVYPHLQYSAIHSYPRVERTPSTQYALFDCLIDEASGVYLSEDYAFCQRWRAMGGDIWLDTAARLTHTGSYGFTGNPASRYAAINPLKASA